MLGEPSQCPDRPPLPPKTTFRNTSTWTIWHGHCQRPGGHDPAESPGAQGPRPEAPQALHRAPPGDLRMSPAPHRDPPPPFPGTPLASAIVSPDLKHFETPKSETGDVPFRLLLDPEAAGRCSRLRMSLLTN